MSADFRFKCSSCAGDCGSRFFSLCVAEQRVEELSENIVETVTVPANQIEAFCIACGERSAVESLRALGVDAIEVADDPPTRPCAKCGLVNVSPHDMHMAYVVSLDCVVGASIEEEILYEAPVCAGCMPTSEGFETKGTMQ